MTLPTIRPENKPLDWDNWSPREKHTYLQYIIDTFIYDRESGQWINDCLNELITD